MPQNYSNFNNSLSKAQQKIVDIILADPTITNQEIATLLDRSVSTIKHHLTTIYEKKGLDGNTKRNKRVGLILGLERKI